MEQAIERSRRDVEGRVAVVTGGARGIGGAVAQGLLNAGANQSINETIYEGEGVHG